MLKLHEKSGGDTVAMMADIGRRARATARPLAVATTKAKNNALAAMADAILGNEQAIRVFCAGEALAVWAGACNSP